MTKNDNPIGYFEKLLVMDCETSGLVYKSDDPSYDAATKEEYQAVSWGLIVADVATLNPIEELYLEVKWNGDAKWSMQAQNVHGLSLDYLEENGMDEEEAVTEVANLIIKHWGPDNYIRALGHNVATFDIWFMRRMMRRYGIDPVFGNRHVDTSTVGFVNFGLFNSNDLFEELGIVRGKHNSLEDAKASLESVRVSRLIFQTALNG